MMVDDGLKDNKSKVGRPSKILFQWGKGVNFEAVVQSVSQNFTMFLSDGIPVRAKLIVGLLQLRDLTNQAPTNPTSQGDGGERIWTVQQGETLSLIAHRALGDTKAWRSIAAMNKLEDVRKLEAGTVLVIPNA
jgi:LysM repeat protein